MLKVNINNAVETLNHIDDFKIVLKNKILQLGGVTSAASVVKVSQPTLSRFFLNKHAPRYATVKRLAKAFNITEFTTKKGVTMQKPDIESVTYLKDAIAELNRLINQGYLRDDRLEHRVQGIIFDIKDIQDAVLNRINEVDYE